MPRGRPLGSSGGLGACERFWALHCVHARSCRHALVAARLLCARLPAKAAVRVCLVQARLSAAVPVWT